MALYAATATATLATLAGLDAALGFTTDIRQLRDDKAFTARLQQWIERLGNRTTLYHMLELADEYAEALWFEGKSWNYRAVKLGK